MKKMKQTESDQTSLPVDIGLKIASSLEISDVCALGKCSRFWREVCGSDSIWEPFYKDRWLVHDEFQQSSTSDPIKGWNWKGLYMNKPKEVKERATAALNFVKSSSSSSSSSSSASASTSSSSSSSEYVEVDGYLKAVEVLCSMQLRFEDVAMILFKPNLNVLLNLVGLHYCINWLGMQARYVIKTLQSCKISERRVLVKWWEHDNHRIPYNKEVPSRSYSISLGDLAMDDRLLQVLRQGVNQKVRCVQISIDDPHELYGHFEANKYSFVGRHGDITAICNIPFNNDYEFSNWCQTFLAMREVWLVRNRFVF